MEIKTCSYCKRKLKLKAFDRNKQGKFGRHSRCRVCRILIEMKKNE